MELDEAYSNRQIWIDDIKKAGKNYNFNKYTDAQLYCIWQRLQPINSDNKKEPSHELDLDFESNYDNYCDCGARLSDAGLCPVCNDGEEDLVEWVVAKPAQNNASTSNNTPTQTASTTNRKYMVGIVSDKGRLRAMSDDGEHGVAFVAFPNNLRQYEGQQYEVDQLIWNGKNYRVAGNIVEI